MSELFFLIGIGLVYIGLNGANTNPRQGGQVMIVGLGFFLAALLAAL